MQIWHCHPRSQLRPAPCWLSSAGHTEILQVCLPSRFPSRLVLLYLPGTLYRQVSPVNMVARKRHTHSDDTPAMSGPAPHPPCTWLEVLSPHTMVPAGGLVQASVQQGSWANRIGECWLQGSSPPTTEDPGRAMWQLCRIRGTFPNRPGPRSQTLGPKSGCLCVGAKVVLQWSSQYHAQKARKS